MIQYSLFPSFFGFPLLWIDHKPRCTFTASPWRPGGFQAGCGWAADGPTCPVWELELYCSPARVRLRRKYLYTHSSRFGNDGDWVGTDFAPVEHVSPPTDFLSGAHLGLVPEPFSLMSCNGVFGFVYASVRYVVRAFWILLQSAV